MVKRWKIVDEKYNFTKTDNQRLGFMREAGYISIKDPYKSLLKNEFKAPDKAENAKIKGNKTILPTGTFVRDETQAGYFQKTYLRSMEGEGLYDPVSMVRQFRMREKEKFLGGVFLPSVSVKQPCGIGSFCATINPSPPAFSPVTRTPKKGQRIKHNYATIPPKEGSAYGYPHVCIGKDPPYASEDFDRYQMLCQKAQVKNAAKQITEQFCLGMYPQPVFWKNPWFSDVPLGRAKKVRPPGKPLAGLWINGSPAKRNQ